MSLPLSKTTLQESNNSESFLEIQNDEIEWLKKNCLVIGGWSHNGNQCTDLARELTTAPGYGKDSNGNYLGGYDYVKQQLNNGNQIPLLSQVKGQVMQCDNLILTGGDYDPAGHTSVVFFVDLPNDTIYFLDQNFDGKAISPRQKTISSIENSTYVIFAECNQPVSCQIGDNGGLIIAAPNSSLQTEVFSTLEVATIQVNESEPLGLIAFIRDGNIWTYDLSTKIETQLTSESNYSMPAFSSDGEKIAFVQSYENTSNKSSIGILDLSTSEKFTLINPRKVESGDDYFPFFHPQWVNNDSELWINTIQNSLFGDCIWIYSFNNNILFEDQYLSYRLSKISPDGKKLIYVDYLNYFAPNGNGLGLIDTIDDSNHTLIETDPTNWFSDSLCWVNNNEFLAVRYIEGDQYYVILYNIDSNQESILFSDQKQISNLNCTAQSDIFVYDNNSQIFLFNGLSSKNLTNGIEPSIWKNY